VVARHQGCSKCRGVSIGIPLQLDGVFSYVHVWSGVIATVWRSPATWHSFHGLGQQGCAGGHGNLYGPFCSRGCRLVLHLPCKQLYQAHLLLGLSPPIPHDMQGWL
jgi:hypothetical protein